MELSFHQLDDSAKADWELRLGKAPQPSVYQSWQWGEHKKRAGWRPERWVFVHGSGAEVGICQFLTKTIPGGLRLIWAPGGPVVQNALAWTSGFSRALWQAACSGNPWAYFRCDPYEIQQDPSPDGPPARPPLRRPWVCLNPGSTVWLDLPESEAELIQGMVKNHRYRFRQALKAGLTWGHEITPEKIRAFTDILWEVAKIKSMGAAPPDVAEMANLADDMGTQAHLTLGYRGSKPVAGALCLLQGHRAWYAFAGCTVLGREVSASYALIPELCKEVRRLGVRQLDLAGIAPNEKKYAGVNDFKAGFGGRVIRLSGEWEAGSLPARLAGNIAVAWRRT